MSSGAVQRGGVPILPESVRVRAALDAGADLVVALPAPYACATAEQFAAAGVHEGRAGADAGHHQVVPGGEPLRAGANGGGLGDADGGEPGGLQPG